MSRDYGREVAVTALTKKLGELLPMADGIDFEVIAEELVHAVDMQAIDTINARERGLQEALQATMAYLSGVIDDLRNRVSDLEAERKKLLLRVARETPIEPKS